MRFDRYTISLLFLRPDAPSLTDEQAAELQDAHLALLAAGPVQGAADRELRGFYILKVDPERARELNEQDPAVRAGRFRIEVYPWVLPGGLMNFSAGRLPRSVAEAEAD
jgi:hypothetical protein